MSRKTTLTILVATFSFFLLGCTVKYSTSGASISPEVKSVSVAYFENSAPIVKPGLSDQLTNALKDQFINQTDLEVVNGSGDLHFEGRIVDYKTEPASVSGDQKAVKNRLTIKINVKFTNSINSDNSYETSFSRFADYDSNKNLSSVQENLHKKIIDQLITDIFNKAVVNW